MIVTSENLLRELRATMGKLEIALSVIPDSILWTDESGIVQWCNASFDQLIKRPHLEILGAQFDDVLPLAQNNDSLTPKINPILQTVQSSQNHVTHWKYRKSGQFLTLEISSSIFQVAPFAKGVMLLIRDITEHKAAENLIRQKSEELLRSNLELEQFSFLASHDLQEPLRKIQSFIDLLKEHLMPHLDEQANKYMSTITSGAERMRLLIEDLLAYSCIDKNQPNLVSVDFNVLVDEVAEVMEGVIKDNEVQLVKKPLPQLEASPTLMRQVFQNLIANAIKFRSTKPPSITISARQKGKKWIFAVQDNGIGIDRQYHDKIFEIFRRLHPTNQYTGSGIGLAICKKIVEYHSGRIWVESAFGKGSTFYFTLPSS